MHFRLEFATYHLKAPNSAEHIESQNGKFGAFVSDNGHEVDVMGGRAVGHQIARDCGNSQTKQESKAPEHCEPKIYNIFIGGAMDSHNRNVKGYEEGLKPKANVINSYNGFNDYEKIDNEIANALKEKETNQNVIINIIGHSLGADTALTEVSQLDPIKYAGKINNLVIIDPVATLKTASTERKNYLKARKIVQGRIIDVNAQKHGGCGDTIAGIGGAYDDNLKDGAEINYIVDETANHCDFGNMMTTPYVQLGGKTIEELLLTSFIQKAEPPNFTKRYKQEKQYNSSIRR